MMENTQRQWMRNACVALVAAWMALGAQRASAQAFTCDDSFYQSQVSANTTIYRLNRGTVPYSFTPVFLPALTGNHNALSYNPVDNYLYVIRQGSGNGHLVQMGPGGVVSTTGTNPSLTSANGAAFDTQGRMFATSDSILFRITNLPPAAGGIAILPITSILPETSAPAGYSPIGSFLVGDIGVDVNQSDANQVVLYGTRSAQAGAMYLYRIRVTNPGTATPTAFVSRIATNIPTADTIGSVWIDANGRMFAYNNGASATEGFYEINTATGVATPVSGGPSVSGSDGANCPQAAQPVQPTVLLFKTTNNGPGPANFTLTNTGQPTGTVTTTASGTPTQVDGAPAPGIQPFTVSAIGQAIAIQETDVPEGIRLESARCLDGTATVGSLAGTTYTIPGASVTSGKVFTCTFVNTLPADLVIAKTNTPASGPDDGDSDTVLTRTATTYSLRITNAGPGIVANAVVRDTPGAGIDCPGTLGSTVVGCTATSTPAGATVCPAAGVLTTANLFGAGIAIPSMGVNNGGATPDNAVTLTLTCTVAAP